MKISQAVTKKFGPGAEGEELSEDEIQEGMLAKSKEFAEAGNKVYLLLAD